MIILVILMKKNKKYIISIACIGLIGILVGYALFYNNSNLIKLNYNEIENKINNKDSFILCISRTTCSHCDNYKPKLSKIANKYNIKIYYTDIDTYDETEEKKFNTIISFDGSTPTTLFIKNGEEKTTATRIEGNVSTEKIIDKLKKNGFIN